MSNLLNKQKSLYLRQHKDNPVNWHPWTEEAFEKARKENKPILLSIGYSSCHWCHVMAHECFEDEEVAKILNESFISIKVDKEEYPDIDSYYMNYIADNFGSGGWPLNVFINKNKTPFYALTYTPKSSFTNILKNISQEYSENKLLQDKDLEYKFYLDKIDKSSIKKHLKSIHLDLNINIDGPRFPQAFLLLYALNKINIKKVKKELINMITKGLFDHIEGGFFRYTIDSEYRIPHFEKMLYDQATLLLLCAEFYKLEKNPVIEYAINKTISWLNNKMKLLSGLYGSATNADTEDGEGYYYSIEETEDDKIIELFNLNNAGIHNSRFVPWINFDFYHKNKEESDKIIKHYKDIRNKSKSPGLDKKSVMSWNCFLGFSLLKCADALNNNEIKEMAINLFNDIKKHHIKDKYYHIVYENELFKTNEYLEDYSSYLLFLSEINKEDNNIIDLIKKKFIKEGNLVTTTYKDFDNLYLWQDSPFPCGGSILLNALLNLNSNQLNYFIPLFSGIIEMAIKNPSFFSFWLYGFEKYYK